jgi:hypothetical protein
MRDLVEQAEQEAAAHRSFGFAASPYRSDQAISDLLSILDDRIESEGLQVGLPEDFLHQMWSWCNEAQVQVADHVWLDRNSREQPASKAKVREMTYRALIEFLETRGT